VIVGKSNLPSNNIPPSVVNNVACLSALASLLSSAGGYCTSSDWKFLSGFIKETITLLYLEFLLALETLIPPMILSSVNVIAALPDVSVTTLYLPAVKFKNDLAPPKNVLTLSIIFLELSITALQSIKSI